MAAAMAVVIIVAMAAVLAEAKAMIAAVMVLAAVTVVLQKVALERVTLERSPWCSLSVLLHTRIASRLRCIHRRRGCLRNSTG